MRALIQASVLCLIAWAADRLVLLIHAPLPGPILGLFALLACLAAKLLAPARLRQGANLILRHLLLFFIPPMLVLLAWPQLLGWLGLELLGIVLLGTFAVMTATGLLVQFLLRHDR